MNNFTTTLDLWSHIYIRLTAHFTELVQYLLCLFHSELLFCLEHKQFCFCFSSFTFESFLIIFRMPIFVFCLCICETVSQKFKTSEIQSALNFLEILLCNNVYNIYLVLRKSFKTKLLTGLLYYVSMLFI